MAALTPSVCAFFVEDPRYADADEDAVQPELEPADKSKPPDEQLQQEPEPKPSDGKTACREV